jgi:phosphatidylserine decarboxylase
MKRIGVYLSYLLPHHLLSRIMFLITRSERFPFKHKIMGYFARKYKVNMEEAVDPEVTDYPTMNAMFTRALKAEARPINPDSNVMCSPVDGTVSEVGLIRNDRIYQAKGHDYSLEVLLGGLEKHAEPFLNGNFATLYLSPKDYHRVHMPFSGTLTEMVHVPGRLFSVQPHYVETVPGLFARNERIVSFFDTDMGPMAVILVGAIFVSSMEMVWTGPLVPPRARRVTVVDYTNRPQTIHLEKGDEMGRFNMGSTVIILLGNSDFHWDDYLQAGVPVTLGESIGRKK